MSQTFFRRSPETEALQQEQQATQVMDRQAAEQDFIVKQQKEAAKAQQAAEEAAADAARAQKAQIAAAKNAGVKIQTDANGQESMARHEDGAPLYESGFTSEPQQGKDGPSVQYRDPRGKRYDVPVSAINRTTDPTGSPFYEFTLPTGERVRQPEDKAKSLFKVDPNTGYRYTEAPDTKTGSYTQTPLGLDRDAAAKAAIEKRKAAAKQQEDERSFKASELRLMQDQQQIALRPVKDRLDVATETFDKLDKAKVKYKQSPKGIVKVIPGFEGVDQEFPIGSTPEELSAAQAWIEQHNRAKQELEAAKAAHDPLAAEIQKMDEQRAKLALDTLHANRRDALELDAMEKAAKAGAPVHEPARQKRQSEALKDPRIVDTFTKARLADEGSPLAEDVERVSLPETGKLIGKMLDLRTNKGLQPGQGVLQPGTATQAPARPQPTLKDTILESLAADNLPATGKDANALATEALGITDPEKWSVTTNEQGTHDLSRDGQLVGTVDTRNNQIRLFPPTSWEQENEQVRITQANQNGLPIYYMGGGQPMRPQELRDYIQSGFDIAGTTKDPVELETKLAAAGLSPDAIRRNVLDGRLSVQDGRMLAEQFHGIQQVDTTEAGTRKAFGEWLTKPENRTQAAMFQNGDAAQKADVVSSFFDQHASQAATGNLLPNREGLAAQREAMLKPYTEKGVLAKAGGLVKKLIMPMIGIGAQATALPFQEALHLFGAETEAGKLSNEEFSNWLKRSSGFLHRINTRNELDRPLGDLEAWMNKANPGDEVPQELADKIAAAAFDTYHQLTPDAAKDLNTTRDTFDVNKDPALRGIVQNYLQTANPSARASLLGMLTMDAKDRETQKKVMAYIEAPRTATAGEAQERAALAGVTLTPEKAGQVLAIGQQIEKADTPAKVQNLVKQAGGVMGLSNPADIKTALDLITRKTTTSPDSAFGLLKGGFVAGRQELATEALTTAAEAGVGFLTAGAATPEILAERAARQGIVSGARAALRRTLTAGLDALSAESKMFAAARGRIGQARRALGADLTKQADEFAKLGIVQPKFGAPLTTGQKARNIAVAGVKAGAVAAPMEGLEEGFAAIGETDPNLDSLVQQIGMGAAGGMVLGPLFTGGGVAAQAWKNRGLEARMGELKTKWAEDFNKNMAGVAGFKPMRPEDFDVAMGVMNTPEHAAARESFVGALAELQAAAQEQADIEQAAAGNATMPKSPRLMAAEARIQKAGNDLAAASTFAFEAADELRQLPADQQPLYTGIAKAVSGAREFTEPEAKALIGLQGDNAVAFQQAMPADAMGPPSSTVKAPAVTQTGPGRYMLPEGVTIAIPPQAVAMLGERAPSLLGALGRSQSVVTNPTPAANENASTNKPKSARKTGNATNPSKNATAGQGGNGENAAVETELTPKPTPWANAGVTTPVDGLWRSQNGDIPVRVVGQQGDQVETISDDGKLIMISAKEVMPVKATGTPKAPKTPSTANTGAQTAPQAGQITPKAHENIARQVIGAVTTKSPKLKKLIQESKQPSTMQSGGMWTGFDGTIVFHMPSRVKQLDGLDAKTAAKRVEAILDEEIRHSANLEAARRLYKRGGTNPLNLPFEQWREAWYGDIWNNHFTDAMRQQVKDAYGDTLPKEDWMRAMEGLRMLDQLRATDSITEAVLRHLEAVLQALREFLAAATPKIKAEIQAIQAILIEFGYEQGAVKPEKATKKARQPKAKQPKANPPQPVIGIGSIVRSDAYRSEGDIRIESEQQPANKDHLSPWYRASTTGGRTFELEQRFITQVVSTSQAIPPATTQTTNEKEQTQAQGQRQEVLTPSPETAPEAQPGSPASDGVVDGLPPVEKAPSGSPELAKPTIAEAQHYLFDTQAGDVATMPKGGNVFIVAHFTKLKDAKEALAKINQGKDGPARIEAWLAKPKKEGGKVISKWAVLIPNVTQDFVDEFNAIKAKDQAANAPKQAPLPAQEITTLRNALQQLRRWKQNEGFGSGYEQAIDNYERGTWTLQDTPPPAETLAALEAAVTSARQFWVATSTSYIDAKNAELIRALAADAKIADVMRNPRNDAQNLRIYLSDRIKEALVNDLRAKLDSDPRFGLFYDFTQGRIADNAWLDMMVARVKEQLGAPVVSNDTNAPTFKVGDRVQANEGTGKIAELRGGQAKLTLDNGTMSLWIPVDRLQAVQEPVSPETPSGRFSARAKEEARQQFEGLFSSPVKVDKSTSGGQSSPYEPGIDSPAQLASYDELPDTALDREELAALTALRERFGSGVLAAHPRQPLLAPSQTPREKESRRGALSGFQQLSEELRAVFGKRVLFVKRRGKPLPDNGYNVGTSRNVLAVDIDAIEPVSYLVGHELGHAIEAQSPGLYRELSAALLEMAGDTTAYRARLTALGYKESELDAEIINDFIGSQFMEPAFWRDLAGRDKSLFERMAAAAVSFIQSILRKAAVLSRDVRPLFAEIDKARALLVEVLTTYATDAQFPQMGALAGELSRSTSGMKQQPIPADRLPGFIKLAQTLIAEGVRTPQDLAAFLEETFPGGKARPFSQALWNAVGMVSPDLSSTPDWQAVYADLDRAMTQPTPNDSLAAQVPEEGRLSVYPLRDRWLVQQSETRGFGDHIYDTEQEAIQASIQQQNMEAENRRFQAEQERRQQEQAAEAARVAANLTTYLDGLALNAMQRGKLKSALETDVARQSSAKNKTYSGPRFLVAEEMVADGYRPQTEQVPAIKEPTRTQWNRMDNRQQAEFERRRKEAGTKTEYSLALPDGSAFVVTKAEHDYANWLSSRPPSAEGVTGPSSQQGAAPALPDVQEPAIDETPAIPQTITDETQSAIRAGDQAPQSLDPSGGSGSGTREPEAARPGYSGNRPDVGERMPDNAPPVGGSGDFGGIRKRPVRNVAPAVQDTAGGLAGESGPSSGGNDPQLPGTGTGMVAPEHTPSRSNYWLADPESIVGGGPKARFARNRKALEILEALQEENRDPTPEELDTLAAYTGWGAFGQELFKGTYERTFPAQGWEEESDWLKNRLGKADWESAQESILNAHYTDPPTVSAMWDMIRRMGFTGGRVLEPSLGTGNFFSLMPRDLMAASQLSGIELDPTTASIAKFLHPQANIRQMGYEESTTGDNFYDLIVGNWPFKKGGPADRRYNHLNASLHDYFFVKAIDQVRPGGLVVGITSAGTMDKKSKAVRSYLASRGELVASFRLPTGAFGKYAGTAVVTDIVILRKRETPLQDISGETWVESVKDDRDRDFFINAYYQTPEGRPNILGKLDFGSGSTYGRPSMIVTRSPDYEQVLPSVAQRLPENVMQPWKPGEKKVQYIANTTSFRRQNAIVAQGDELYQVNGENLGLLQDLRAWKTKDQAKRLADAKSLLDLRSLLDGLMDAYRKGEDTTKQRETLLAAYTAHVKTHGPLHKSRMLDLFRKAGDPTAADILNMEEMTEKGPRPRAILTQDIMRKRVVDAKGSIADAYALARNNSLQFSVSDVAEAAGVSVAEAEAYLIEQGQIYRTPQGVWEPADVYLAGNVRQKLREAQAAKAEGIEGMERNIAALESIQPADTPYFEIEVQMGASWIPISDYQDFISSILQASPDDVEIVKSSSGYNVKLKKSAADSSLARSQWGTEYVHPSAMFGAAMNSTPLKVYSEPDKDGVRHLLADQTEAANQKRDAIREELVTWLWSDPVRTARLVREYNESMNAVVTPKRDGSHLRLEGLALTLGRGEFDFRQHQRDAVWRFLLDGKGVGAHEVGTGKTFTIAGLAMEGRRLGVLRKPMILAHNANSSAIAADISKAYPSAKVLYLDDLGPQARENAMRQIKLDDWDAVVVPHSLISRFALKRETMMRLVQPQIDQLEAEFIAALDELDNAPDVDFHGEFADVAKALARVKGAHTAKDLMKRKIKIEEDIEKRAQATSKEGAISFEELGIDAIIVDEAHIFKKIPLATRKNFKGLQKEMSGAGFQLQLMTDYLKSINNGKGVFLFTGTPVTNTLNEVFNMMRFVMQDEFTEAQIANFDDWFNSFAQATSDIELTSGGTFEPIERVLSFINIPELARMASRVFDVVRANDMPEFKPRASDDGLTDDPVGRPRRLTVPVIAEMSPDQREHKRNLEQRYREYQALDGKGKMKRKKFGGDVPAIIETDGRKSALDHRVFDPGAADFAGSKLNLMVGKIMEHFREHPKATQMVFQEIGVNDYADRERTVRDGEGNARMDANGKPLKEKFRVPTFNLLRDMVEKLVAQGVRPEEIAVFHNMSLDPIAERPNDVLRKVRRISAATPKEELAAMMNRGEIRVAFGSTQTMGTGVNAQEWLRAMHHLDAPWTPGEFEQRNGRGWRQGNRWNTVMEYRYFTEESHDGKMWQTLLNKVRFIERFTSMLQGKGTVARVLEGEGADTSEDGSVSDFEQSFSSAAGDPRLLVRAKLEKEVQKLQRRRQVFVNSIANSRDKIRDLDRWQERDAANLPKFEQDHAAFLTAKEPFSITINGKNYTERKDATDALERLPRYTTRQRIGEFGPFGIYAESTFAGTKFEVTGPSGYTYNFEKPSMQSLEATLGFLKRRSNGLREDMAKREQERAALQDSLSKPWSREADLAAKEKALAQIQLEITASPTPAPSWLRHGAPTGSLIYVRNQDGGLDALDVAAHRWDANDYWILVDNGTDLVPVRYNEALTETGSRLFQDYEFQSPGVQPAADAGAPNIGTYDLRDIMDDLEGRSLASAPRYQSPPGLADAARQARAMNSPASLASIIQKAYAGVKRGSSSVMVPIHAVYMTAKAAHPEITPDGFMAEIRAADERGDIMVEAPERPETIQQAGPFVVRNALGVPSTNMMVVDQGGNRPPTTHIMPDGYELTAPGLHGLASAPAPDKKAAAIKEAIATMPPMWREALELSMKGTPPEDIATRMNLSETAVGNILRTAQGRLRILLEAGEGKLKPTVRVEDEKVKAAGGRPDLAMSGKAAFAAVDQRRRTPEEVTHGEMEALAQRLFATDAAAAENLVVRWMDSGTTVLSTEGMPEAIKAIVAEAQARSAAEMLMTAAAKLLVTEKALAGGNAIQMARLIDLYRNTGTEQARALNMRYDPHATPEERAAMYISEALLTPPESMRNEMRRNPANKERILAAWAAEAEKLKEQLKAEGYDIDATFKELAKEKKLAEAAIPQEVKIPLAKASNKTRRLVKAVLEGMSWGDAAKAASLSFEAARKAYMEFRDSINNAGVQAAQQAKEAMLRSAPVDFAAQLGLPEWLENASPDYVPVKTETTEALKKQRTKKKAGGEFDLKDPVAGRRVITKISAAKSTAFDKISEYWRASILSGPQTHVVNVVSGVTFGLYESTFKKLATATQADIARMFGMKPDAASLSDIPGMLSAVLPSIKQAFADGLRAWKEDSRVFDAYAMQVLDDQGGVFKEQSHAAIKGKKGAVIRSPFRLMGMADEFVKSFFTRIEVAAQARQIARNENLTGEAFRLRIAELMEPGSLAWERALGGAKRITFQNEEVSVNGAPIKLGGPLASGSRAIDAIDGAANLIKRTKKGDFGGLLRGLSHFIFPFVDTPTNIFKMGVQMSPVGGLLSVIDAVRYYNLRRKGNNEQAQKIYNAARAFDDLANQIVAWGFILALSELVKPGDDDEETPWITGTLPWRTTAPGEREIAYRVAPPQSIRIGGQWISYKRLDPFASALAFTVDAIKEFGSGRPIDETWGNVGLNMMRNMQDKTFLQGVSDLFNAINDPERFGTKWAVNLATGFVPNLIRQPVRTADPLIRESDIPNDMGLWDALARRVGYSVLPQSAMPAIDVWGREQAKNTGTGGPNTDWVLRLFSPADMKDADGVDYLDVALLRYNMAHDKPFGVAAPSREIQKTINGKPVRVSLDDAEYDDMARKAGKAARAAIGDRFKGRDLTENDVELIKDIISRSQGVYRDAAFTSAFQKRGLAATSK